MHKNDEYQTVSQGILADSLATFKDNPMAEVANRIFGPLGFILIKRKLW